MNQAALAGMHQSPHVRGPRIERPAALTNCQVVNGDHNVVIWGDGNTVIQKIDPNQKPTVIRLPAPVIIGRPNHSIRFLDRAEETKAARHSLASGAPLEFFGSPGYGKTTLLRHLAYRLMLPDGMVFLELRNRGSLEDVRQELFEAFYQCDQNYMPNEVELRHSLQNIYALILLDDCGLGREDLQYLRYLLPCSLLVISSCEQRLWGEGTAIALGGMPERESLALFQQQLGRRLNTSELQLAERVCSALEGNPLEIIQAAGAIRNQRRSLAELATEFATAGLKDSLHRLAISRLPELEKNTLAVLAVVGSAPLPAEHLVEILQCRDLASVVKDLLERGLIKAHSPRYSLTGSLQPIIREAWDISGWDDLVLRHFREWSARGPSADQVIYAADATFTVLDQAARLNRWQEVFEIGQAIETAFILGRRWGEWGRLLPLLLRAGQALGDKAIEAWALHQAGTRALGMGQFQQARDSLVQALDIRKAIGDKSGIQATKHNLAQLPGGTVPPRTPPHPRSGPSHLGGWIAGLAIAATILGISLIRPSVLPPEPTESPTPTSTSTALDTATSTFLPTDSPTATPISTVTATPTMTITPTPTPACPNPPAFTFSQNANCREGPSTAYGQVTSFNQGQIVSIVGQNEDDPRWWLVTIPGQTNWQCWVSFVTGSTCGPLNQVPAVAAPPLLPGTPTGLVADRDCVGYYESVVNLSWNDVNGENGYLIYRDGDLLTELAADTSTYTDSSVDSLEHTYFVKAYNEAGATKSKKVTAAEDLSCYY